MNKSVHAVRVVTVSCALAAALLYAPSASAAGFFEQLFGGGTHAVEPAPSYGYAPAPGYDAPLTSPAPDIDAPRVRKMHHVEDSKPILQKTTDLMHDKTLRPGDAVMTKTGITIYQGWESSHHTKSQFAALDEAHVSKTQRATLLAMDEARRDPLEYVASAGAVKEGRSSASDTSSISSGYKITDLRGRSIRYVGP